MSIRVHAAWSAGAAILLTASRFVIVAVLARRLEQHALGAFAYAQWMLDIGFLLASIGATGAASRYIAEYRLRPGLMGAFLRMWRLPSFLLPLAGALVGMLGVWLTGAEVGFRGMGGLFFWALFAGLWAMQTSVLTGLQRFDVIFLANLLAAAISVLGVVIVPMTPHEPSAAFVVMGSACAAAFVVGFFPIQRLSRSLTEQSGALDRASILRYCLNVWVTALLWSLVWSRGEVPLVRHFLGEVELANYSVALNLVGGAIAGVMLGVGSIAPQVTRLLGDARMNEAVRLCRTVGDWQLLVSGSAAVVLIWLSPELLRLAFGPSYAAAIPVVSLLAAGLPALSFSMHNHLLQILTGSRFNRDTTILGLCVLGVSAALMTPRFGIEGAALARVLTLGILALVSAIVFSLRAGHAGVNRLGLATVMLVTAVSAIFVAFLPVLPVGIRMTLALVIIFGFSFGILDKDGRPAFWVTLRGGFR